MSPCDSKNRLPRGLRVVLYHILHVLRRCECCNRQPFCGRWIWLLGILGPTGNRMTFRSHVMSSMWICLLMEISRCGSWNRPQVGYFMRYQDWISLRLVSAGQRLNSSNTHTARMKRCKASSPKVPSENGLRYKFSDPTWRMDLWLFVWMTSIVYSLCTMD